LLLPLIAVACYLFGAFGLALGAYYGSTHHGRGGRIAGALIAAVGVMVHVAALADERKLDPHAALSLGDTAAIVGLLIAVTALLLALKARLRGMAAMLLVIAAALEAAFSEGARSFTMGRPGWELSFHVAMATTAFAFLTIGAALAASQVAVDHRLRSRKPLGIMRILTPLESLESGCFHSIQAGFFLLTLTLVTGAFFVENLFAQHLIHKVVLAIMAWIVFGVLLLGRWRFGWRGRKALRWTLAGYVLLGLSYFGSKLVLENLLGRHWG
jgi:ABC-type uncharacterized transport system permease subunit